MNSYKISVKEWVEKTNAIAISQMEILTQDHRLKELETRGSAKELPEGETK